MGGHIQRTCWYLLAGRCCEENDKGAVAQGWSLFLRLCSLTLLTVPRISYIKLAYHCLPLAGPVTMALLNIVPKLDATPTDIAAAVLATALASLFSRIVYNLYLHPLSKFPGPWYAASFSIVGALISVQKREPQWLMSLVRRYGSTHHLCSG